MPRFVRDAQHSEEEESHEEEESQRKARAVVIYEEEVRKAERSSLNASEWTDNIQGLDGSCRSLRTLCPRAPPHHFAVYSLNRTF